MTGKAPDQIRLACAAVLARCNNQSNRNRLGFKSTEVVAWLYQATARARRFPTSFVPGRRAGYVIPVPVPAILHLNCGQTLLDLRLLRQRWSLLFVVVSVHVLSATSIVHEKSTHRIYTIHRLMDGVNGGPIKNEASGLVWSGRPGVQLLMSPVMRNLGKRHRRSEWLVNLITSIAETVHQVISF